MDSRYITSALKPEQLPPFELPEVAFIGRSNCGKSTLLNTLLGHKGLARTSRTPGRTQMVNFFSVDNALIFVDLPGYGFHEASRDVAKWWQPLVDAYMRRPNIRDFLFLADCRREFKEDDLRLLYALSRQLPPVVVLTKSDKISQSEGHKRVKDTKALLKEKGIEFREVFLVSSQNKKNIEALREDLLRHKAQPTS